MEEIEGAENQLEVRDRRALSKVVLAEPAKGLLTHGKSVSEVEDRIGEVIPPVGVGVGAVCFVGIRIA